VKRNLIKNESGTELIEFAIISTLLFIVLFGIIDFAILLYDKAVITNASREGARAGIVQRWNNSVSPAVYNPLSTAEVQAVVNSYLASNLISFGSATATVTVTNTIVAAASTLTPKNGSSFGAGDERSVQVTYPYNFLAGFIVGSTINLSATTKMRME
jgi:Flp pilus assembly protein TadG